MPLHTFNTTDNVVLIDGVPYQKGKVIVDPKDWKNNKITLRTPWDYNSPIVQELSQLEILGPSGGFATVAAVKQYIIDNFFFGPGTAVAPSDNNVDWVSVPIDPVTYLANATNIPWNSAPIGSLTANLVVDAHNHPDNYYLIVRYPIANTVKTMYDESDTPNQNIPVPGIQFPDVSDDGTYNYIFSDSVTFSNSISARLTFHT